MGICRNKDFVIVSEKNEILMMDIMTLSVFHRRECGVNSPVACSNEYVFIGDGCGVMALGLLDLKEREVCRMKTPVTAIFHLDGFIYCGSEEGTIYVYGGGRKEDGDVGEGKDSMDFLGSELSNEMFSMDDGGFKLVKTMKHPGPVTQICSDGTEVFVADMRNKVTVYPSKKTYDIKNPKLAYKNYIFASERNMLYCKTRNAFATYLTTEKPISGYTFSMNGGVLFAQCRDTVDVVDFNTKKVVKKVEVAGKFVYDDVRDRLVWFDGKRLVAVENVLEREYKGMDGIMFREDGLVEKKIKIDEEMDENIVEKYREDGLWKKPPKRKYFRASSEGENGLGEGGEEKKEVVDPDEWVEEAKTKGKDSLGRSKLEAEPGSLLCYNTEGYMTCIGDEERGRIEINYHDVSRRRIEVDGIQGCTIGSFCQDNIIVGNGKKIFYIGPSSRWEKEVEASIVSVSEKMVVSFSGELRVFGLDGSEMLNCLIPDVSAICCRSDIIVVFSREIIVIDLFKSTERFFLPSPVDFACFDEGEKVFYRINGKMYQLYKGLSVRVCEAPKQPLAVFKGNVISLGPSRRLFPSPHVEYTQFDVFDPCRSKEPMGSTEDEEVLCSEDYENKNVEVSKSKRYNPLKK
ncbi:uncharacterized protein Eint_020810 [Encephalitozoon intestinalis ATCC 50506]|uniref:Uncharacterized protein n=1 Tax=Encephalitozoon intestinalis (strain ATCC 50506) TaxID=876142 RepID=E0S5U5_ENCIT|nr:uncharacterized protein Eint_020810 [Encephalitozoon intestinalis ATCC 50506]ADM11080.1 hypothetical protein Eint_020810 [Encephalitozoon intestinalis ATCC 50506]UTX44733.1 hypothetical protein GPK93_02g02500 [Encephalitozoon intestinalis]